MRIISIIILLPVFTACTPMQIIDPNKPLEPEHGLVLLSAKCAWPVTTAVIYKSEVKASTINMYSADAYVDCLSNSKNNKGVTLLSLPEGDYYFGSFGDGSNHLHVNESPYRFTVTKSSTTYIGYLEISGKISDYNTYSNRFTNYITPQILDREKTDIKRISEIIPGIIKKYPYNKEISHK